MKKTLALIFFSTLVFSSVFFVQKTQAFGECSEYGYAARYDSLSHSCECMSGYVMGRNGCVMADSMCHDKYGYNSRYDSLSDTCECSYGYVLGKDSIGRTQCVSENSMCTDQLGFNSRYNSLSDKCECSSGYVIDNGTCKSGNTVCDSEHGLYSSYNSLSKKCECDYGYTFDDSDQCVKKQNNVYFTIKELDTYNKQAIVKSDYDYRYSLISYNAGCYSINRYLNRQIVVNLGTDFSLDSWDKIVLQDDDENCDVTRVSRADVNTTLESEDNIDVSPVYYTDNTSNNTSYVPEAAVGFQFDESKNENFDVKIFGETNSSAALRMCPSKTECKVIKYLDQKTKLDILGGYDNREWYRVIVGGDSALAGWMHNSVVDKIEGQALNDGPTKQDDMQENIQHELPWYKKMVSFFTGLFN